MHPRKEKRVQNRRDTVPQLGRTRTGGFRGRDRKTRTWFLGNKTWSSSTWWEFSKNSIAINLNAIPMTLMNGYRRGYWRTKKAASILSLWSVWTFITGFIIIITFGIEVCIYLMCTRFLICRSMYDSNCCDGDQIWPGWCQLHEQSNFWLFLRPGKQSTCHHRLSGAMIYLGRGGR